IAPKGFKVVRRERTMGLCGMPEAELSFEGLEVADDMVLRTPSGPKRGFAELMTAYNSQRVGAGTIAMGVAAGALEHAKRYLLERHQFGRPIAEFQGLQWMLADMATSLEAARLLVHKAASSEGTNGFPDPLLAAQAKILASETAVSVTNNALQLHGAPGYSRRLPLERMVRDARMFTIGGGTAQLLRNLVASRILDRKFPQTRDGYVGWEDEEQPAGQRRKRG
ncbi:MAG: acyl-CoA dehydrogenase family protein, partial [Pseudomonadota bacterium]